MKCENPMTKKKLNKLLEMVRSLTASERELIVQILQQYEAKRKIYELIESRFFEQVPCPYCESTWFYRRGRVDGLQRYYRLICQKTCNTLIRLHKKDRWLGFLQTVAKSCKLRQSVVRVNVNINTALRWWHQYPGLSDCQTRQLELTREQVCMLTACVCTGDVIDFKDSYGKISADKLKQQLLPILSAEIVMVSDAAKDHTKFTREVGLAYGAVITSTVPGASFLPSVECLFLSELAERVTLEVSRGITNYLDYSGRNRAMTIYSSVNAYMLMKSSLDTFQPQIAKEPK